MDFIFGLIENNCINTGMRHFGYKEHCQSSLPQVTWDCLHCAVFLFFILCFSSTELPLTFNTEIQKSQFLSYRKPHANLVVVIFLDCTRSRLILKSPTKVFLIMSGRLSVVVCQLRCLCGKAKNDENFTIVVPFFFYRFKSRKFSFPE